MGNPDFLTPLLFRNGFPKLERRLVDATRVFHLILVRDVWSGLNRHAQFHCARLLCRIKKRPGGCLLFCKQFPD
jgi:hypothetical protein